MQNSSSAAPKAIALSMPRTTSSALTSTSPGCTSQARGPAHLDPHSLYLGRHAILFRESARSERLGLSLAERRLRPGGLGEDDRSDPTLGERRGGPTAATQGDRGGGPREAPQHRDR